jgi:transposase-like protein
MNLFKLMEEFGSDDACRQYLERLRWPDGPTCVECGSEDVTRLPKRNLFQCSSCRHQFSVTSGTIMHDTHLPLTKWVTAIYLIVEGKKGISSRQLGRTLGTTPRTAWFLSHRIREALRTPDALLSGIIEVDETWIGGKVRGMGKGYVANKSVIVGAVERGGDTRLRNIPTTSKKELHGFINEVVSDEAEAIYTDEHPSYTGVGDEDTRHETVQHRKEEWVRGDVSTNTVEGVWALFKRGVAGSFHKISRKHLERYLDEFEFRFNNRNNPFIFRDALKELVHAPRLEYRELIG